MSIKVKLVFSCTYSKALGGLGTMMDDLFIRCCFVFRATIVKNSQFGIRKSVKAYVHNEQLKNV